MQVDWYVGYVIGSSGVRMGGEVEFLWVLGLMVYFDCKLTRWLLVPISFGRSRWGSREVERRSWFREPLPMHFVRSSELKNSPLCGSPVVIPA